MTGDFPERAFDALTFQGKFAFFWFFFFFFFGVRTAAIGNILMGDNLIKRCIILVDW